jgi:hypothetical protein
MSGATEVILPPTAVTAADMSASRAVSSTVEQRLLEQPKHIRDAAHSLSREFIDQAAELKKSRPNDEDLVAFLEKMAEGLERLANALDQCVKSPEPIFLGKAAEIARQLSLGSMEWLEANRTNVTAQVVNLSLFGAGIAFVTWIGADSFQAGIIALLLRRLTPKTKKEKKTKAKHPRK